MIHAGEKRTLLKHARIKQNGLDAQSTFPSGHNPINWNLAVGCIWLLYEQSEPYQRVDVDG